MGAVLAIARFMRPAPASTTVHIIVHYVVGATSVERTTKSLEKASVFFIFRRLVSVFGSNGTPASKCPSPIAKHCRGDGLRRMGCEIYGQSKCASHNAGNWSSLVFNYHGAPTSAPSTSSRLLNRCAKTKDGGIRQEAVHPFAKTSNILQRRPG